MNSVQENDRGWYMCQVRSIQSGLYFVTFISIIMMNPLPLDQHGSNGSQVGLKNNFSQSETDGRGLKTTKENEIE